VRRRALAAAGLALVSALAVWADAGKRSWAAAPWTAAVLLPFLVIPSWCGAATLAKAETADLESLSSWAASSTSAGAVFLFPDAGRDVYPGVFRARALRAVYVDWKGGGQVNFLTGLAREWWRRWQQTGAGRFVPSQAGSYAGWGIDYFVVKPSHHLADRQPVFVNNSFLVYATR
jgi:hypothetical protein